MNDDKQPLLPEKAAEGFPLHVPAPPTKARVLKSRLSKGLKYLAISSLLCLTVSQPHCQARPGNRPHRPTLDRKATEQLFLSIPNPASAMEASRKFASKPHLAGTTQDFETAKDFLALLQQELGASAPTERGLPIYSAGTAESRNATLSITSLTKPTAWIDVYYPQMNTPLKHSVEILGDDGHVLWSAPLEEVVDKTDPYTAEHVNAISAFHGFSRSGEVQGKLVFANYGTQQDYKALVEQGVDLAGKIVLVKYGRIFRGLKVKGAEELGAAGVLIYSDPSDDGSVTVENGYLSYPYGPARNPTSVQRGSVQYLSSYPGDPTTPGYPSYENSTRTEGGNIPSIPSLPLSWANAQVLLREISEGGLNRVVSFTNMMDTKVTPIWNTMGVIPGHIKSEVVVIGNHRDAWVFGATDPSSGTASVHEVVRAFGALIKQGWQPLRTIVFASWDAEEYGLIGSTEWGEDFAEFIDKHVVAYLNVDSSAAGSRFRLNASPSLAHLVRGAADDIPHPTKPGLSLWDATMDSGVLTGPVKEEALATYEAELQQQQADYLGVTPLGSGSDYTVFLQHIGVASTNGGFGSTLQDPVYHYHSIFDSERWQELYGDPGFVKHVAVAKHLGLTALRLADSIILPLNTTHYSLQLEAYLNKAVSLASAASFDVDFSSLREAIRSLQAASAVVDQEKATAGRDLQRIIDEINVPTNGCPLSAPRGPWKNHREAVMRVIKANAKLVAFERGFISKDGIKDREWYKHLGVAPGKWLGYGATTLPALTEAFTIENNASLAKYEAKRLETLINALVKELKN
ncbi:Zn-dependent exopeptidase [Cytidiella melzeri]|nr:Zn-dependent exopeptidase [Cytidiella melzeri]